MMLTRIKKTAVVMSGHGQATVTLYRKWQLGIVDREGLRPCGWRVAGLREDGA